MRAATFKTYGSADVLELGEVETPEVGPTDVLVEVHASEVTQGDRRIRSSDYPGPLWIVGRLMYGLFRPRQRVPGTVFAGRIVEVGDDVSRFEVGQDVYGECSHGAYAEYLRVAEDTSIASMPANVSYDEAATLPYGAATAQAFLREVGEGDRVLIVGAAGGVGRYAVQYAKHLGAHVVGVCKGDDAEFVRRLGADEVVDYSSEDVTQRDEVFDVIFDTSATATFRAYSRILADDGKLLSVDIKFGLIMEMLRGAMFGGKTAKFDVASPTREDLEALARIVEHGGVHAVIDRSFPLAQIREAHRRLERDHPRGSVVVSVLG